MMGLMEGWGAWTLETFVGAGLVGCLVLAGTWLLRPGPRVRAISLVLAMLAFAVPPLLTLSPPESLSGLVRLETEGGGAGGFPWLAVLAVSQGLGLMVGLVVLGRSAHRLRGLLRDAEPVETGPIASAVRALAGRLDLRPPRIYLTSASAPMATGMGRGSVLLPRRGIRELDPRALEMVLAHEMAHLARRDPLVGSLRHLLLVLWWFHPVAWALVRAHRRAAEDACDDVAVLHGRGRPVTYCETLLALAAESETAGRSGLGPIPPLAAPLASHPLARRFRRILGRARTRGCSHPGPGQRLFRGPSSEQPRLPLRLTGSVLVVLGLAFLPAQAVSWEAVPDVDETAPTVQRMVIPVRVVTSHRYVDSDPTTNRAGAKPNRAKGVPGGNTSR